MTAPAPSETLVAAADLIRDLAAAATPGPWSTVRRVDSNGNLRQSDFTRPPVADGCSPQTRAVRSHETPDYEWIAALSPALAPLLINWLEAEAACIASVDDVQRIMPKILDGITPGAADDETITVTIDTSGPALAFARAILGSGVDTHG